MPGQITPPVYPVPVDDAITNLAVAHTVGQSTLTVTSAAAFGSPSVNSPLRVTVQQKSGSKSRCHYLITSISGNVLTIASVLDGYSDIPFSIGDNVGVLVSAGTILDLQATDLEIITVVNELSQEGVQGPQGFQGNTGSQGAQGSNGSNGAQGAQGAGVQGAQGVAGTNGSNGVQGAQGAQGASGSGTAAGATGQVQYNSSGAFAGAANVVYSASGNILDVTMPTATDVPVNLAAASGTSYSSGTMMTFTDGTGALGGRITATGAGVFSGKFDETNTTPGLTMGYGPSGDTPRVMFCNGNAGENWQIDNDAGTFRWFTPGVTRMTLDTNGNLVVNNTITANEGFVGTGGSITQLNASNINSGTVPTDHLGSGTASSSTFLRGDSTWQTISGGAQGPQGAQGSAGPQGNQGSNGSNGVQGVQGYQGATGSGTQGAQGASGPQGNQGAAGAGTPAGSNQQIQYNNSGSFGGSSGLTWDGTHVNLGGTQLSNGTLTTSGGSLTLQQTGDSYGLSALILENRGGANGATFSTVGATFPLVDFGFTAQSSLQSNLRYENRSGSVNSANVAYGAFQVIMNSTGGGLANQPIEIGQYATIFYSPSVPYLTSYNGVIGVRTNDPLAVVHICTDSATPCGIDQAASGQTADLRQWQSSTGSVLASVNASGKIVATSGLQVPTGASSGYVLTSDGSGNASWAAGGGGAQGAQGAQGSQGVAGAQGHQGFQGYQGANGSNGAQGNQGYQGVAGSQGAQGSAGPQGNQGFQGSQGNQGAQGSGVAAGSSTDIQFNNSGVFAGDGNLTWNNTNKTLTIGTQSASDQVRFIINGPGVQSFNDLTQWVPGPQSQAYGFGAGVDANGCLRTAQTSGAPGPDGLAGGSMMFDFDAGILYIWSTYGWEAFQPFSTATSNAYTASQFFQQVTLTDGSTIYWALVNAQAAYVTLGGNRTLSISGQQPGASYTLIVKQDSTGGRTMTWDSSIKWPGGTAPTLSTAANATDIVTFLSDGTYMYGGFAKGFA